MAKRRSKTLRQLRDADDLVHLITGKRIHNLVARGIELFGKEIFDGGKEEAGPADANSPYAVLGVREDAADIVVKAAYRSLCNKYHPDTAEHPDPKKLQDAVDAYAQIMRERHKSKEAGGGS